MRCPKCHAEVEKGNLYCPNCLTEIPWVQEFNSVETLLKKKEKEEPESGSLGNFGKKIKIYRNRRRLKQAAIALGAAAVMLAMLFFYRSMHSFDTFFEKAESAYKKENLAEALSFTEKALEKRPNDLNANLMLAKLMDLEGEIESAVKVMKPMLKLYPDSIQAYKEMLHLLEEQEKYDEIKKLLSDCQNQKVLDACSEYICEKPVSSLPPGTYTSRQTVSLSASYDRIYYTVDGSVPTENSTRYTGPIVLGEGTTVLQAIGINDKNISSDVISRKYVIVITKPDPPEISPDDGDYSKKTQIEIQVPDGCRAYYAFDKIPTVQSTVYETPISMPEGFHVFYAILVAANGEVSEPASRSYYLQY